MNTEKLAIARKALLPGYNISSVARGESLPESTVRGWVNNLKKLEEDAVESNYGSVKSMHSDKTLTLTIGLKAFCQRARSLRPPAPITIETISTKAKDIAAKLLAEYEKIIQQSSWPTRQLLSRHIYSVKHGHLNG